MKIIITGGAGFLGSKLADELLKTRFLTSSNGSKESIEEILLIDRNKTSYRIRNEDSRLKFFISDLSNTKEIINIIGNGKSISIFHLASIVSADAEQNIDRAIEVNITGLLNILNACRELSEKPKFIFTSSFAVFGGEFMPNSVSDYTKIVPQNSYGMTKSINELIVNDYSRKGYIDGRGARLPTIIIRPGKPNKAASSFASGLFREPLAGKDHFLPVSRSTKIAIGGYKDAVEGIVKLHEVDKNFMGDDRTINFPNISTSVSEMIDALLKVKINKPLGKIIDQPDMSIQNICEKWPAQVLFDRASGLGITKCSQLEDIIHQYIDDYMNENN
ncbi:MAG: NAD-dependent epimerase [Rhodospirillaceae bacterium]|nr:NAD-dependent epimerase [Rhodospirillaceae bacterium]|tara:strand:- start:2971 stop:3966 length:996 start_codon:yes stop_codon:yes gene_type:complete